MESGRLRITKESSSSQDPRKDLGAFGGSDLMMKEIRIKGKGVPLEWKYYSPLEIQITYFRAIPGFLTELYEIEQRYGHTRQWMRLNGTIPLLYYSTYEEKVPSFFLFYYDRHGTLAQSGQEHNHCLSADLAQSPVGRDFPRTTSVISDVDDHSSVAAAGAPFPGLPPNLSTFDQLSFSRRSKDKSGQFLISSGSLEGLVNQFLILGCEGKDRDYSSQRVRGLRVPVSPVPCHLASERMALRNALAQVSSLAPGVVFPSATFTISKWWKLPRRAVPIEQLTQRKGRAFMPEKGPYDRRKRQKGNYLFRENSLLEDLIFPKGPGFLDRSIDYFCRAFRSELTAPSFSRTIAATLTAILLLPMLTLPIHRLNLCPSLLELL
ncbi:NADH-quinone oxidoreductase subunit D 2 [Striga asiatica]|uniref:NADH-quinone oxidoreductase subunit D 2 n=1 Tax=Striga asiatica TaxID=4170 RepID=A0A5A7Q1Y6_STRAF|nr:NADH-quinone oxidoreductase subunit D 2 [Striga asiatica]